LVNFFAHIGNNAPEITANNTKILPRMALRLTGAWLKLVVTSIIPIIDIIMEVILDFVMRSFRNINAKKLINMGSVLVIMAEVLAVVYLMPNSIKRLNKKAPKKDCRINNGQFRKNWLFQLLSVLKIVMMYSKPKNKAPIENLKKSNKKTGKLARSNFATL